MIEQEFAGPAIKRPGYGITGWNILTLIQYGTEDQVARWVRPALHQDVIWCQLFSEPDAGSDAAGVKTRATRVDGGWLVNGQKVWTSGAHVAGMGFATVRTNPDVPKHEGITMMVIDMHADGVEVRPLQDDHRQLGVQRGVLRRRVRPRRRRRRPGRRRLDGGPRHARQREREHRRRRRRDVLPGRGAWWRPSTPTPSGSPAARPGSAATSPLHQAMGLLNLRAANRAVAGAGPGPEGAMTKLVLSELGHEAAAMLTELNGPDAAFIDGDGAITNTLVLMHRGMSIAGGTSEIKRNQIGERILGLPRDPLIK